MMQSRVGSLEYTAPEIFANVPYDKSCDIWSIGVITYILYVIYSLLFIYFILFYFILFYFILFFRLTGLFPFADKNPMKLYEKITNVDYNWEECPDVSPHGNIVFFISIHFNILFILFI